MTPPGTSATAPAPDLAPPADVAAKRQARRNALLLTTLTAAIGPTLLVTAPLPLNMLLAPALVTIELALLVRRRSLSMFALRVMLGISIVTVAAWLPVKPDDAIAVTGLPTTPTTIAAFNASLTGMDLQWRLATANEQRTVAFSQSHLTLRAFVDELSDQLDARVWIGRCGNGSTILFGAAPMGGVIVDDR